jgi:hypothetical protein
MTKNKIISPSFFFFLFSLFSFLFSTFIVSCQTSPKIPQTPEITGTVPLDPGGSAYILADAKSAGPILENLNIVRMDNNIYKKMLKRTAYVAAAVYPQGNETRFRLATWGRYPASQIRMVLGLTRGWKKNRSHVSGKDYWYSPEMKLSVAVSPSHVFVSSFENEDTAAAPYSAQSTEVPEDFGEFLKGAALSCWMEDPGPMLNKNFEIMKIDLQIPAERLFFSLFPSDSQTANGDTAYEAKLRIQFSNVSQAIGIASLLSLGRTFTSPNDDSSEIMAAGPAALMSVLFSNPPVRDGKNLNIKTDALSAEKVSLLFSLFSL